MAVEFVAVGVAVSGCIACDCSLRGPAWKGSKGKWSAEASVSRYGKGWEWEWEWGKGKVLSTRR